ncbi:hypothetical protein GOHSU_35_00420 [Gordonia hirsuta DSM 44140 = NBRC 16056]|uniref:Streptomycin 6-kinase n=1 Tax=Gordonia hirsuta DSM 44140 = NBRC 16056 TaxID=1121927 RepID=L7LDV2_9ACTN|nr:aminoglycoside phosphotransferase family protein [Gordonia hirsuta]GAC58247.1 hypothetical protein GOHSU_35_00420 [Gordonia hirsuta DSM 44140 = NBRC 16056]
MEIPAGLAAQRRLGPDWASWLDLLPSRCTALLVEWELEPSGEPMHGHSSLVLPVHTADGRQAVLKVGFDGSEQTADEHLALQVWAGGGAVRMFRADPVRRALLLERLSTRDLSGEWDVQACQVIAGLYERLHVPASPRFARLPQLLEGWLQALDADARNVPVPPRLIDQALVRGREFVADPDSAGVLVHGDLHYENVLAADRAPWLAIDPQPMSGDRHYEVAPLLWNRWDEMAGYLRPSIQQRFFTVVEAAGLDEDRARDWVLVRMVLNAHWAVSDAVQAGRALDAAERDWITRCIAVAKATQP